MRKFTIALLLASAAFVAPAHAAYVSPFPLTVTAGGTGATTLTAHGVLLGQGTSAVTAISPGTTGIPLIGQTAADPIYGTAVVGGGGTGQTTLAANGVLVGEGTAGIHVVGTSSTADALVAWAAAGSDPAALSIPNCADSAGNHLNYTTAAHTFTCGTTSSGSGTVPTLTLYTSTLPMTMGSTNLETVASNMATPAAGIYNLPSAPATSTRKCLKDGTTNFATNNATVKTTDSSTIDGVAGATGIIMNQTHQETCFIFSTNWYIE